MTYFTTQNAEGFSETELALLNSAMGRILKRAKWIIARAHGFQWRMVLENYERNAADMLIQNCSDAEYAERDLTQQDIEYEIFSVWNRTLNPNYMRPGS